MTFTRWRLLVLSLALFATAAWAIGVLRERSARRRWNETLRVAVVVISPGASAGEQVDAVERGLRQLEGRLALEADRYAPGASPPFAFDLVGPIRAAAPPLPPPEGGLLVRARHAVELWRALRAIHARAPGFVPRAYDARLYLTLEPAARPGSRFAEGAGAAGGEVGLVRAAVDPLDPTLAVEALAHELLHCLGATDKYAADGHAAVPEGLADPGRTPTFPQERADVMGVEVALGLHAGRLPSHVDELAVGPATALEIGWAKAD